MNSTKIINIIRWTARILGIGTILLFLIFFIGESDFSQPVRLTIAEILLIICVPILLITGIIIAWKREILGGLITILSIFLFNIIGWISEGYLKFELEFGFFLIIGMLYIICGISEKRLQS